MSRLMRRDRRGEAPPDAAQQPERAVLEHVLEQVLLHAAARLRRCVDALALAAQRHVRVREHVELEVVVRAPRARRGDASVSSSGSGWSWRRIVNAGTLRSVSDAITPRLPTPTRAARQSSGSESREHSTNDPSAVTSSSASTWLEMLLEALARAVRGGRDRAGDRLHVDVAQVLERAALARTAPR